MFVNTGIDLIEIDRLQVAIQRHGNRFLHRIYTLQELKQAGDKTASLAARFAAKEAVSKALGSGIGKVWWQEIEVLNGSQGEPLLHLYGKAQTMAIQLGLKTWSLSLSHTHRYAVAVAIAMGE